MEGNKNENEGFRNLNENRGINIIFRDAVAFDIF